MHDTLLREFFCKIFQAPHLCSKIFIWDRHNFPQASFCFQSTYEKPCLLKSLSLFRFRSHLDGISTMIYQLKVFTFMICLESRKLGLRSHCSVFKFIRFCRYPAPVHTTPVLYKNGEKNIRFVRSHCSQKRIKTYSFLWFMTVHTAPFLWNFTKELKP